MYKIEDVTKVMDMDGHETEDGYNAMRTTMLGIVTDGLEEFNTVVADRDTLKAENERLKQANAMLYGQIEKQYTARFTPDGNQPNDENNDPDDETNEEKIEKILKSQVEMYGGLF
jgi:hypothetical protein